MSKTVLNEDDREIENPYFETMPDLGLDAQEFTDLDQIVIAKKYKLK